MSQLQDFLKEKHAIMVNTNNLYWSFMYNDKHCVGRIDIRGNQEQLYIMPMKNFDDIGNGVCQPVVLIFDRSE